VTHTAPVFWFSPVPVRIDRCLNGNFLSLAVKSTTTLVMKLQCDCSLGSSDFLMLLLQLLCRTVTCSSRLHDRGSLVLNRRRSDKNEDHTSVFSGGATALPLFVFFYMGEKILSVRPGLGTFGTKPDHRPGPVRQGTGPTLTL
jgi:hypothetical protein